VFTGLPLAKGFEDDVMGRYRGIDRQTHGWLDSAARRFFGGGRHPTLVSPAAAPLAAADLPQPPVDVRRTPEEETVVRPEEGEEVRIRVSGGDIIIEKHTGGTDNG
jgi:hypothetical protein